MDIQPAGIRGDKATVSLVRRETEPLMAQQVMIIFNLELKKVFARLKPGDDSSSLELRFPSYSLCASPDCHTFFISLFQFLYLISEFRTVH